MKQEEMLRYVGSMQQLAYVRPLSFGEGRARGLAGYEVQNGPMSLTLMADKCLDVAEFRYRGVSFHFLSKPGLQGRNPYDTNGEEAQRSIMGGLMFTCGAENICAPCELDGKAYPMHGRMRTTPAEHLCADARWDDEKYVITVSGEMREAELFGENITLRRTFITVLHDKSFSIRDTFCNEAFREEPLLLLYHCNFGYPFLTENSRLHLPSLNVRGREEWSKNHVGDWDRMNPPKENEPEYVYEHRLGVTQQRDTLIMVENPELALGMSIRFNRGILSNFMQWKSIAAGDYVLGLEPTNADARGRMRFADGDALSTLKPLEKVTVELVFTVLDGEAELKACREEIAALR